jgi:hypothetical protein
MNLFKFIHNLFIDQPKIHTLYFAQSDRNELFFYENRYIQASDLFLKEIELLVNGNVDLNKDRNKQKIQILLKIFREIEYNLVYVNSVIGVIKCHIECDVSRISSNVALKEKYSEQLIAPLNALEKINKLQSLLSDIQERKRQVDKRVKELGTHYCYKIIFLK